ncbi:2-hydroxyacid dehydrogenase [Paraburkholderia fungorum]|uniref:2-hydroxyacid dehydrogenase n=1 Tax=Paraburkholderia fungorum TaxID=134537 RepID=UPI0038BB48F5
MKVFMIGEAANHIDKLAPHVPSEFELVPLPREAAYSAAYDAQIGPQDCVVSLRLSRRGTALPRFRMLHVPGAGLDGIEMESLPPECVVCNVFEHEIPIAEFVMLAMLEWQVRLRSLSSEFTAERWSEIYRQRRPHGELYGKVFGLVGLGRIGRAVARLARAFGMQVLALDKYAGAIEGVVDRLLAPEEFPELLAQADFIGITCPLTAETRNLFDADAFARMKRSAVLINVSRAEIANEQALYAALSEQRIGGAVLDVWYRYPANETETVAPSNRPFHTLPNVIATPHSSAWTTDLPYRRYAVIGKNLTSLARGEPLLNVVRSPER